MQHSNDDHLSKCCQIQLITWPWLLWSHTIIYINQPLDVINHPSSHWSLAAPLKPPPPPALDGGRLWLWLWEGVRKTLFNQSTHRLTTTERPPKISTRSSKRATSHKICLVQFPVFHSRRTDTVTFSFLPLKRRSIDFGSSYSTWPRAGGGFIELSRSKHWQCIELLFYWMINC